MRDLRNVGAAIVCVCAGGALGTMAVGCSSNSSTQAAGDSGVASAGDGATTSLYQRLGGHAGIRGAVDKIVGAELGDPELASYFVYQTMSPTPAGHPNVDQLEECLTDQLASAAGGTESYPTTVTDDAGSWTSRDMTTIHKQFHISGGTFSKFVMIAAGELQTLGVAATDIATVGSVLTGEESAIVDSNLTDAGELAFDAGSQ